MKEDEKCTFCSNSRETLVHLFWDCPRVRKVWEKMFEMLTEKYNIQDIRANPTSVIFNKIVHPTKHIAKLLCLLTKQYIYRQKCKGEKLNFVALRNIIRTTENIEKYIAGKNNRIRLHERKWARKNNSNYTDPIEYARQYVENIMR